MERVKSASLLTAIKTPYQKNRNIDWGAFDALVEFQLEKGVDGFVIGGTTGEGHLMAWEEHLSLIAHSVHHFGDRAVIIGNTGSNNTHEAIAATEHGFASGMHAALQINPYYGKTSESGLQKHFDRVLEFGPAIIYNVPGRTGQDLPPHFIENLAHHQNFAGVKECMGERANCLL